MEESQPGQVISPNSGSVPAGTQPSPVAQPPVPGPTAPEAPEEAPAPTPAPEPATPTPAPALQAEPSSDVTTEENAGWQYHQDAAETTPERPADLPDSVSWSASEFIAHDKGLGWYALLALGGIVAAAIVYFLTRDKISTGVIVLVCLAFGFYASRKPHTQQYELTLQGLQIGSKFYGFHDFKTFSIAEEGAIASIVFMPLKRFMPPLTVYVAPDIENQVVDFLSAILPFEQHKADAVDSFMRRIRF